MKGFRTIIFGVIISVLGFLEGFDWVSILPAGSFTGFVITGIGAAIIWLRKITNTALGESE